MHLCTRDTSNQGQPALIYKHMVLAAELATIGRVSAGMLASEWRWHAGRINAGSIPDDLVMLAKPSQYCLMNTLPNTRPYPFVKATPAGHAAAVTELTRQILPRYSSLENKQDFRQR